MTPLVQLTPIYVETSQLLKFHWEVLESWTTVFQKTGAAGSKMATGTVWQVEGFNLSFAAWASN
jgi:hypothetical protein